MAAFTSTGKAQDLTIKSAPQAQPIAIHNATIHTVSGPDIADGAIVFEKGRITAIYTSDEWQKTAQQPKSGWKLIDANDGHVYPGLIGAYTHIGMTEIQAVRATIDFEEAASPITPEVRAATAVNPDSTIIPVTRSNGVLTVGVFPAGGVISGQVSAIRMEGWTTEELTLNPSLGIAVRWPNTRAITAWWNDRSEEDQMREIRQNLKTITDAFDAAEAYARAKAADPNHPTDLRWEAMRAVLPGSAAFASDLKPVVSESAVGIAPTLDVVSAQARTFILANDVDQITSAVAFAVTRKLRPVIVGGRDAALCADLLKKHDVPVIVQGVHRMPRKDDAPYDEAYTLPARLHAAGVRFCIATNDDTAHERNLPYNAAMAQAHGLPADAALKSVTLWPAQILGIDREVGSLEVGKAAVLIVTTGNPLEVTTHVKRAYSDGRDMDLSNKQTKLDEKYRERYRQLGLIKEESQGEKQQRERPAGSQ
ncbi:MAG TPA: amidohydrolase family protein [Phycisphaerales bacterium]|nr:amidohydrolase family protein [Phycisphaerales bacterium]